MSAINFLSGMANGYMDRMDRNEEKARRTRMDQIVIDRAERERRAAEREDRSAARQEKYQSELDAASTPAQVRAEPVSVEPSIDGGGGTAPPQEAWNVGGRRFTSMVDAAKAADAATAEQSSPDAVRARQLDVVRRYNPTAAVQMETSGLALEREQVTNKRMRQVAVLNEVKGRLLQGGWAALPAEMKRYRNGFDATVQEDGQGGAYLTLLDERTGKPLGKRHYPALDDFVRTVSADFDPDKYMSDEQMRKKEEKEFGLKERQVSTQERVAADNAAYHRGVLDINRTKADAGSAPAPLWDAKADDFLKSRYTVKDEVTGATTVDGNGLEFAKTIALGMARRNGGDTTVALGRAFDIDSRIREATKGDPAAIRAARAEYIKRVTAPRPAAPGAAPSASGASAIPPAEQAARDAEAGQLMIRNEFGGDVARAQAEVARMRAEVAKAPIGEPRAMAESQLARLQAGIDAALRQAAGGSTPAAAPAPAATPAPAQDHRSRMMQAGALRAQAKADPEVKAAQAAYDGASNHRAKMVAADKLNRLLAERYGL